MIDYKYYDLFLKNSISKQVIIRSDNAAFTNEDLYSQEMTLRESLCSEEELTFGACEASTLSFKISDIFSPMHGKWIDVSMAIDGHSDEPLEIGRYKVESDKLDSDRRYREIVAYDAMYDIINSDVAAWYNSILPEKDSTVTMRQFRESFVRHFGLTEVVPEGGLVNDDMVIEKTIEIVASAETGQASVIGEALSGLDVITAICEINGCFGHIGRDGKFHYIYLPQAIEGLYPANDLYPDHAPEYLPQARTGHLYPQDPKGIKISKNDYITVPHSGFRTKPITALQIRQEEDDIGVIYGSGDNCYIIQGNFLVYGKSSEELRKIASNIFEKITDISYRPFEADCLGNPCLEVGDPVRFSTTYELVESYILSRTLKGTQALRDDYKADGVEQYAEKVNGVQNSIMQLKGKSNTLSRTIEETRLEMKDIAGGLSTQILATAEQIRLDAEKKYETKIDAGAEYANLRGSISLEAGRIASEIERATKAEQNLSGQIVSASSVLSSKIEQTESSIMQSVSATYETKSNAGTQYESLSASISLTTEQILQKVSKGSVSSEISQEAGKISITSDRFSLQSTNCTISEDGTIKAVNCELSGTLKTVKIENDGIIIDQYGMILVGNGGIRYQRQHGSFNEAWALLTANGNDVLLQSVGKLDIHASNDVYITGAKDTISASNGILLKFTGIGNSMEITINPSAIIPSKNNYCSLGGASYRFDTLYINAINQVGGNVGFFGTTPAAKQTVSTMSSTSSTEASTVATKVNEVINALKKYGLL